MAIVFHDEKDALNRQAHGIGLARARAFEVDTALIGEDDREDHGEVRYVAIGRLGRSVYVFVFTYRGDDVRAISLRRAEKGERAYYEANRP